MIIIFLLCLFKSHRFEELKFSIQQVSFIKKMRFLIQFFVRRVFFFSEVVFHTKKAAYILTSQTTSKHTKHYFSCEKQKSFNYFNKQDHFKTHKKYYNSNKKQNIFYNHFNKLDHFKSHKTLYVIQIKNKTSFNYFN